MTKTRGDIITLIIVTVIATLFAAWVGGGIKKSIFPLRMNIFDEILYNTQNYFDSIHGSRLTRVPGLTSPQYVGLLPDPLLEPHIDFTYKSRIPSTYGNISISVDPPGSKGDSLYISFDRYVGDEKIHFSNSYDSSDHILEQRVSLRVNYLNKVYLYSDQEAQDFLAQHSITSEDLDSYNEAILNDVVLTDWTTVYDSRFSPDNYGDVEVTKQW